MGKRTAPVACQKIQAKAAKIAEAASPLDKILALLGEEGDFSDECRTLLTSSLPHALNSLGTERHQYQQQIIGFVEGILSEGEAKRKVAVTSFETAQREFEAKKSESEVALQQAKAVAAASTETKDSKEQLCNDAQASLDAAKALLAEKQAAASKLEDDKQAVLQAEQDHKAGMEEVWSPLKASEFQGSFGWRERNKKITQATVLLEKCGISAAFSLAVQAALKTKANVRGTFANKTLEFAEEASANYLQSLQTKLDGFATESSQCTTAVEESQLKVTEAEAALAKAQEESVNAQNTWAEEESKVFELNNEMAKFDPEAGALLEDLEQAKAELATFADIRSSFVLLRDAQPPARPVAEAVEKQLAPPVAEAVEKQQDPSVAMELADESLQNVVAASGA